MEQTRTDRQNMLGLLSVPRLRRLYFMVGGKHTYRISRQEMETFVLNRAPAEPARQYCDCHAYAA